MIGLVVASLIFVSSVPPSWSVETTPLDIDRYCSRMPHPEPCKFYLNHPPPSVPPRNGTEFREMMLRATLELSLEAHRQVVGLRWKCRRCRAKYVWRDCRKLYDIMVLQLNQTLRGLGSRHRCSYLDAQTWLSTALTNIETCRLGFRDLNTADVISPAISVNLSRLISNTLAVNEVLMMMASRRPEDYDRKDFPSWVSNHDRKLLQSNSLASVQANLVVAKDGSGNSRTIQEALNEAAKRTSMSSRFIIYVKSGVYREIIEVAYNNDNIMLIGEGIKNTIISGGRSVNGGYTTYSSATAGIDGLGFIARDITFCNTAGPNGGQAVALRSASDLSVFYRCAFLGYQDTLWVLSQRQFYKASQVFGTVDFIFGNAAVVFQNCQIYARKPENGQPNVITAQGRNDPYQNTGIVIHKSQIRAAPDLAGVVSSVQTYLGRPWMQYSRTVYMETYMSSLVSPTGWLAWDTSNFANTVYYGEYMNTGPGSSTSNRVKWNGYHVITSPTTASSFTVGNFIAGQSWLPATGVPFTSGL
ncbi:hypothetical protein MLD38_025630 [Melastoma candidum]|uniref:Uncharacterized protein n=1 Tax=Melastoma candidum TaxID=119954 RepID=A0ACB9NVW4_9MYRT|nr:hypothetical protein MLD38_025630 [Melastoma candidum]